MRWTTPVLALLIILAGCEAAAPPTRVEPVVVRATPEAIDFGATFVGKTSLRKIRIENGGRRALEAAFVDLPTGIEMRPPGISIAPGGAVDVQLLWSPDEAGILDASLELSGTDLRIPATGIATERGVSAPEGLDFGEVILGESKTLNLEVISTAEAPQTLELSVATDAYHVPATVEVGARETVAIPVRFEPQDHGPATSHLRLRACSSCPEQVVLLSGSGIGPAFGVSPPLLDLGGVPLGTARTAAVELRNDGELPLPLAGAVLEGSSHFQAFLGATILEPGGRATIPVTFSALDLGPREATLVVTGEESLEPLARIPIRASGGAARYEIEPLALDFGYQPLARITTRTLTLHNVGDPVPASIASASIVGPQASAFAIASEEPITLVDGTATVDVELRAASTLGVFDATLVLVPDDAWLEEIRIPLHAERIAIHPCTLEPSSTSIDFGAVPPGTEVSRHFRLQNAGAGDCLVWDLSFVDDASSRFAFDPPAPDTLLLGPGESFEASVRFLGAPSATAPYRTKLRWSWGLNAGELPVSVRVDPSAPKITPMVVDFGEVPVGRVAMKAVQLRGTGTWQLGAVAFEGASVEGLSVHPYDNVSGLILAGETLEFRVLYAPQAEGKLDGELVIPASGGMSLRIDLGGEATGCVGDCGWPKATCPTGVEVGATDSITLDAGLEDAPAASCTWSIEATPAGPYGFGPVEGCSPQLTPGRRGTYTFSVLVADAAGRTDTCTSVVESGAPDDLWIEVESGIDRLGPTMRRDDSTTPPPVADWSCWDPLVWGKYCGSARDWDAPGPLDDPTLYPGNGTGSEQVRIAQAPANAAYWFALTNNIHSLGPGPTAMVRIFCGGAPIWEESVTLADDMVDRLVLGRIDAASCTFSEQGYSWTMPAWP